VARRRAFFFILLLVVLRVPSAAAAERLTISADAGLGGVVRAGRWAPVRVDVDNHGQDVSGTLTIEWGKTTARRAVAIAAPARRSFQFYVRTGDVRDVIVVHLESGGRELQRLEKPVRIAGSDETIHLCVESIGSATDPLCSATLASPALPDSWRGYDAADAVTIADASLLNTPQHRALDLWRAIRRAEDTGRSIPATAALTDPVPPVHQARPVLTFYLIAVAAIALAWPVRRSSRRAFAAAACVIVAGSAAAAWSGRSAPVILRHTSIIRQFAGEPGALVTTRAVAEFPSDGEYAIHPVSADGALDPGPAYGVVRPQDFDEEGYPVLRGRFGLGASEPFGIEVAADVRIFDVSRVAGRTRITNVSGHELRDCEFPSGFTPRTADIVASGASVTSTEPVTDANPILACRFHGAPIEFVDAAHNVVTSGTTVAVYHLASAKGSNDTH
jgi:hypothetical protein